MNEHDDEPIPGLPEHLPPGERLLWQGTPRWRTLARRAFHVRKVAAYFAILLAWRLVDSIYAGAPAVDIAGRLAVLAVVGVASIALLSLLAWLFARTTLFTITSRRVVVRFGVALPMVVNFPFAIIGGASLLVWPDGTGDIPLQITGKERIAYVHLWPYVRRWKFVSPEPMLRSIPDAARVAEILAGALTAAGAARAPAADPTRRAAGADRPAAVGLDRVAA